MLNPILSAHGIYKGIGGTEYKPLTQAATLRDKQGVIADTTAGSFTVTLPASPKVGTQCFIADGGNWAANPLTVNPNGRQIENQAVGETLSLDIGGVEVQFVYTGTKWKVYVKVVSPSGNVVSTNSVQRLSNKTLEATTMDGTLTFAGLGRRILADFSNVTQALRTLFQTSTTNANTILGVIPNGTAKASQLNLYNTSDPDNAGVGMIHVSDAEVSFRSARTGTANYLPMTWWINGIEFMRLGIGGTLSLGRNFTGNVDTVLRLEETNHATSKRAAMTFGTSWVLGQDSSANGTKDFFLYSAALSSLPLVVTAAGHTCPGVNNTFDLGSTSLRWRNIYTQDLHLSNGIGDYTMIEGEEDLFLVNNKNGKHYKFALIQVDPSIVPAKSEAADGS